MNEEIMDRYCNCMEEIKRRVDAVNAILQKRCTTPYPATNIEFMCLQIRSILELIALGSLIPDEDEYKKQSRKLAKNQWRAKVILDEIEKINPKFYPVPVKEVNPRINPQTGQKIVDVYPITEDYLTRAEFPGVYDQCSDAIHSHPFFKSGFDYKSLERDIPVWITKVMALLNCHEIQLLNEKQMLRVAMKVPPDGKVQTALMERIDNPTL